MKGRPAQPPAIAEHELCRGPGNLTMAMGITLEQNRTDLEGAELFVDDPGHAPAEVRWGSRIGIRVGTEYPWRAWVSGHPAVSAHQRSVPF